MTKALTIARGDSVATLLEDGRAGDTIGDVRLAADVPRGHKVALTAIPAGAPVVKFGFPIGIARRVGRPHVTVELRHRGAPVDALPLMR